MVRQISSASILQTRYDEILAIDYDVAVAWNAREFLEAIVNSASDFQSWRHPLGFIHSELTPLVAAKSGTRYRLHVWDNKLGTRDDLGDLHDHIWDLKSWVLYGLLEDSTFRPVRSESGDFFGSRIIYGDANSASPESKYRLDRVQLRRVGSGSLYTIPSGVVHSSKPIEVPSVTLVVSEEDPEAASRGPLVLSRKRAGSSATSVREEVSSDEVRIVVRDILAGVGADSAVGEAFRNPG